MANNRILDLALRITADLRQGRQALAGYAGAVDDVTAAEQRASAAGEKLARTPAPNPAPIDKSAASARDLGEQLARVQQLAVGIAGIALGANLVRDLARNADAYTNLSFRIRLVSSSEEEFLNTRQRVIAIASESGQALDSTATLYTRLARSMQSAGTSQSELLRVTETINKSMVVSGATAQESSAAIIQLSQGLASGVLRGEEFNSVSEQAPVLLELLQRSLGKTRGELRKMAEDGLLTTNVVFKALLEGGAEIDSQFAQMPLTIERASTRLSTAWQVWVGEMDQALGSSASFAEAMDSLAENFDLVANALLAVAAIFAGRYAAATITAIKATLAKQAAANTAAAAELREAQATQASALAALNKARAMAVLSPAVAGVTAAENAYAAALARTAAAQRAAAAAAAGAGGRLLGLLGGLPGLAITLGLTAASFVDFSNAADLASKKVSDGNVGLSRADALANRASAAYDAFRKKLDAQKAPEIAGTITALERRLVQQRRLLERAKEEFSREARTSAYVEERAGAIEETERMLAEARRRLGQKAPADFSDAQKYIESLREQVALLGKTTQLERARVALKSLPSSPEQAAEIERLAAVYDREQALARAREESRRQADQKARSDADYVAGLQRQAALLGLTAAAARDYEIAQRKLSATDAEAARAAAAKIETFEAQRRAMEGAAKLEIDYLRATGNEAAATAAEIKARYAQLRADLEATGNTTAVAKLDVLIDKESARAQFNQLQNELRALNEQRSLRRETAQQDFNAGRISQPQFRETLTAIDSELLPKLRETASAAETVARALGDPLAVANIQNLTAALDNANQAQHRYLADGEQINGMLTDGLADALMNVADGTMSAGEAFKAFAAQFLRDIAMMILKQMIFNAISGGTAGGGAGGATAGFLGGLFAEGGWTGPGGKYEPAGIVHRDEYVIPKRVVQQPGALAFLSSFHREGMAALTRFRGYAEGGLVGAEPGYTPVDNAAAMSANVQVNQRLLPVLDPDLMSEALKGPAGEKLVELHISRNPGKFKQLLGI